MSGDAFQALRLTDLPRRKIVFGYLLIALNRLRLLWVLTFGMLFILMLLLAKNFDYFRDALIISLPGGAMGASLNWLAICTGVWSSIRWRERWSALVITLTIIGVVLVVTLTITGMMLLMSLGVLWYSVFFLYMDLWWVIPILTVVISVTLSLFFLYQAEQQI
jgi:hypothetical protein